jgi:hypothetical protein
MPSSILYIDPGTDACKVLEKTGFGEFGRCAGGLRLMPARVWKPGAAIHG